MATGNNNHREGIYQVMTKSKPQPAPPPVNKSKIRGFHLIPDTVACEGTTTVTLIFDEIPEMKEFGRVEVSVRSKEKTVPIVATPINQRSFYFTAPENRAGEVPVMVFVDSIVVASSHLNYRPEAIGLVGAVNYSQETVGLVTGVAQIHLQILSKLCRFLYVLQTKHQIPSPMPELDQFLAEWYDDKQDSNKLSPKALEELFDILRHSPPDAIQSPHEFPTLLHLTAEFGLEKLAERLMDLPGAKRASQERNCQGLTPVAMARNNGYGSLSATLGRKDKPETRRSNISHSERISKVQTLMPQENKDDYYMMPDAAVNPDFEDNYGLVPCSNSSTIKPPKLCKSVSAIDSSSSKAPRTSLDHPPVPEVPRRESRDSGAYVDGADPTHPPPITRPYRPGLSRGDSEPVCFPKQPVRSVEQRKSEDSNPKLSNLSEHDIRRQLSRPVHPPTGPKRPSVTK